MVSVLEAGHCIRLLAFLPLDNVELDFVTSSPSLSVLYPSD